MEEIIKELDKLADESCVNWIGTGSDQEGQKEFQDWYTRFMVTIEKLRIEKLKLDGRIPVVR